MENLTDSRFATPLGPERAGLITQRAAFLGRRREPEEQSPRRRNRLGAAVFFGAMSRPGVGRSVSGASVGGAPARRSGGSVRCGANRIASGVMAAVLLLGVVSAGAEAPPAPPYPPPPPPRSHRAPPPPAPSYYYYYPPPPVPPPPPLPPVIRALYAPFYAAGLVVRYGVYYGIVKPLEVFGRALDYGVEGGVERGGHR